MSFEADAHLGANEGDVPVKKKRKKRKKKRTRKGKK
jgi:hypothetical protein